MDSATANSRVATGTPDRHKGSRPASRDSVIHVRDRGSRVPAAASTPATSNVRVTARDLHPVSVADTPARVAAPGQVRIADPNEGGNTSSHSRLPSPVRTRP